MRLMLKFLAVLFVLLATACSQGEPPPPVPAYDTLHFNLPDATQRAFFDQVIELSKSYGLTAVKAGNLAPLERKEGRGMTALTLRRGEKMAMVLTNVAEPGRCTGMAFLEGFETMAQYEAFRARFLELVAKSGPSPELYFSFERGKYVFAPPPSNGARKR